MTQVLLGDALHLTSFPDYVCYICLLSFVPNSILDVKKIPITDHNFISKSRYIGIWNSSLPICETIFYVLIPMNPFLIESVFFMTVPFTKICCSIDFQGLLLATFLLACCHKLLNKYLPIGKLTNKWIIFLL